MADAAVEFLLENLKQLLLHHAQLLKDAKGQVEQLQDNVGFFKSFLKKVSSKKLRKDDTLKALVRDIRSVIYDADDVIDAFVTQAAEKKTHNYFSKFFNASHGLSLIDIAEKVAAICGRITQIYGGKDKFDLVKLATADDGPDEDAFQPSPLRKDNVVGLKDEADKIVGYLNATTSYLDVISIIGMPGLGKTTLTGKIYHDPDIKYGFPTRIWVYVSQEFPSELDCVGREIAENCDGLPLAIVVIGGVLATKVLRSVAAWEKVSASVTTFLKYGPQNRMDKIISLSYEKLPYHLKECFLYLGMFPEDFEIPAWKLIQMWITEGLIQPKDGLSMEEIAEYNLDDMINRNLVRVEKLKADGRVKSCRIHDMLHDFCRVEGGKDRENFLQEIKQSSDGGLQPSVTDGEKHRRLCIHSHVVDFLNKNPKGPYVRSFVTFSEDIELPTDKISAITAAFKLLRVLEAKPLKFIKLPSDFYQLIHLRYLALSMKLDSNTNASIDVAQVLEELSNVLPK